MAGRNNHFSNVSLFFSLLITGVVLLFLPNPLTSKIHFVFCDLFEPMLRIGRDIQMGALRLNPGQEETVSQSDYEKLWRSYNNATAQLHKLNERYEVLANLRSGLPRFHSGILLAEVTSLVSSYGHEIIINQGREAGIRAGQYVLDQQTSSVIGIVRETSDTLARVRLITDEKQNLEILVRRAGTDKNIRAMMVGNGKNACKILLLDREQDVREGDAVYAAAYPGWLETPIIVGEIIRVQDDEFDPLLWDITVQPAQNLSRLEIVAVIVPNEEALYEQEQE